MPFEPGKSGNPGGRKRNTFVTDALIIEMKAREGDGDKRGMRKVAMAMWDKAEEGDIKAAEYIRDTIDGRPMQAAEVDMSLSADGVLTEFFSRIAAQGQPLIAHDSDN